jgi:hypothetical protein
MNKARIAALVVALGLAATPLAMQSTAPADSPVVAASAHATGLIKCDKLPNGAEDNDGDVAIRVSAHDPIVYHNVDADDPSEPQPHQHDFAGNRRIATDLDPNSLNYKWMRDAGNGFNATSCRIPEDTAAYWWPSLICTAVSSECDFVGQRIGVAQFSAYYRGFGGQTQHAGSEAIPKGARLVASQSGTAGGGPGFGLTGWTCGQNGEVLGGQATLPDCSASAGGPGDRLTAHVNFPSCWNGVMPNHPGDSGVQPGTGSEPHDLEYLDTRDNNYGAAGSGPWTSNDFIYPANKTACPASHPREVTQLRETVSFDYTGDGTDVALSSDFNHDGVLVAPRGSTFHVDFWNTWDQTAFVSFINRCVQTSEEANCKP